MQVSNHLTQRMEGLATFLDSIAFERSRDLSLAQRRKAAWREASNRIKLKASASEPPERAV
jgi:hypothetical protein